jgi:hypothetical protein
MSRHLAFFLPFVLQLFFFFPQARVTEDHGKYRRYESSFGFFLAAFFIFFVFVFPWMAE